MINSISTIMETVLLVIILFTSSKCHLGPSNGSTLANTSRANYVWICQVRRLGGDKIIPHDSWGNSTLFFNFLRLKLIIKIQNSVLGNAEIISMTFLPPNLKFKKCVCAEVRFHSGTNTPPESVCSLPCQSGQAKKYVEGERCCWYCFNCTRYQVLLIQLSTTF